MGLLKISGFGMNRPFVIGNPNPKPVSGVRVKVSATKEAIFMALGNGFLMSNE